jgi:hypothetical protein
VISYFSMKGQYPEQKGGDMKYRILLSALAFLFLFAGFLPSFAEDNASVETFSPQGTVKGIRQVSVRFSEQIVAFGDPRLADPFEIQCPEKGRGRWVDSRIWVYDFDKDMPAGISCNFRLKSDLRTLSGRTVIGQHIFSFSTGGPAVISSTPGNGADIDEDQIFILGLDSEASEGSIESNTFCSVEGINEFIGVRLLKGQEKEILLRNPDFRHYKDMPVVALQCRRHFPNKARVTLIWGKGITSPGGIATTVEQVLNFRVRDPFTASFSCGRENAKADCIPILPMQVSFASPVSWNIARNVTLKGGGRTYKPAKSSRAQDSEEDSGDSFPGEEKFVRSISFTGPFPENSSFLLELPKGIKDDGDRKLANGNSFPLRVNTDSFPPLAKFSSRFGIIELKGDATLPVTLRNLEPEVKTRSLKIDEKKEGILAKTKESLLEKTVKAGESVVSVLPGSMKEKGQEYVKGLKGRLRNVRLEKEEKIIGWLRMVAAADRQTSILKGEEAVAEFAVPKPGGSMAFEVVGIPLKDPGLYVVEMESRILGAALLAEKNAMYVPSAALVTNLSAHFKWGRESSLVWVTTLDKAEPVKDASVSVRDCNGKLIWKGMTNRNGLAFIKTTLPSEQNLPGCSGEINYQEASQALKGINSGLFVFARTKDDMTFVHSSWDNGIEPWRFNLPWASENDVVKAHTVLDRSLLRAGDTVHMKHIIRKHTTAGFSLTSRAELPKTALISHQGSNQHYEFQLKWDDKGIAETTWKIPREVKLGYYAVVLLKDDPKKDKKGTAPNNEGDDEYSHPAGLNSASFRVEEFRVPLMKGSIQYAKGPLVNASEADIDLLVTYLSGGGANNLAVKLRSQVQPRQISFDDYEDYAFANGEVREGITKRTSEDEDYAEGQPPGKSQLRMQSAVLTLDKAGNSRATIKDLPGISVPHDLMTELEFMDPNGEVQTVAAKVPLYPSGIILGIKPDSWAASKDSFKFFVAALDLEGRPAAGTKISVELLQKKYYSHRKRLVGGFYAYEHASEIKLTGHVCEGITDQQGLLICETRSPVSGNVILQARAVDNAGNSSTAHRDVWIAGKGDWWFEISDSDRIDLLPEKKRYEPGETARFQLRMPFREATALITVEREGIVETFIKIISGKKPVIEIPVKGNYAPNVFVSVLCVRGRIEGQKTTALIDLGKPAYKLGIAAINVGWRNHELRVAVSADKNAYRVREKAKIRIAVRKADGKLPPKGSEIAVAAVDEGLLELMPNKSWRLLEAMMGKRGYELKTSTAQMQVIGKRHYGVKAMPHGGGGGKNPTRELFDTLLYWKARVPLDEKGEASVEIPLNDSLTGFRIVAVASGGSGLFGTGETGIRTTQDLIIFSGLPLVVREGDRFRAVFTARNASTRNMNLKISGKINAVKDELDTITESLSAGEAREFGWEIEVPQGVDSLSYEVSAKEEDGPASDSLKIKQKVSEAIQVRTLQATISQLENPIHLVIEKPFGAVSGKGGTALSFSPGLSGGLSSVTRYMRQYPYTCMEQKVSRAIALKDTGLWKIIMAELPASIDSDGFLKYFPSMKQGSDVLTSYVISIADEAGWAIPSGMKKQMEEALLNFVEGKITRHSSLAAADLAIRKLAALEALSRSRKAGPKLISSITIEPNLWPTSALLDWMNILIRTSDIPDRDKAFTEAGHILRSRINLQGTTMNLSTERTDNLWWLMVSGDLNAVKIPLTMLNSSLWNEDMPRIIRGALNRQQRGAWNTTTANAWGILAFDKFSKKFESAAVTGITTAVIEGKEKTVDWKESPQGKSISAGFPKERGDLTISHQGGGKPWITIQSLAALPLRDALSSGYKIKKTFIPVEQKNTGRWGRGDILRVRLELEAQADMTWVVLNDPIPAGANILGTGLRRDSQLLTKGDVSNGSVWPAFEERSLEAFRVYYEYVPKGRWTVEYTVRLNNPGLFHLPTTRIEALYAPEMFGEMPNENFMVGP